MQELAWEPWSPNIGDNVEVRLSLECVCPYCENHAHGTWWEPGNTYKGTVREIRRGHTVACRSCGLFVPGHYYLVAAESVNRPGTKAWGWAAAIELRQI